VFLTSSSVSSKILNEIYLLQVRLSNVIASTEALVVYRRRIGKITENPLSLALQHSRRGSIVRQDDSTRD
jgi:hypothetical protein